MSLFEDDIEDEGNDWCKEWQNMPEYVQGKEEPFYEVTVRFKTKEDTEKFFKIINQNIPPKMKSIWFPKIEKTSLMEFFDDES